MRSSNTTNRGLKSLLRRSKKPNISYQELEVLTARIFAESMMNLNRYQAELEAVKTTVIHPSITGSERAAAERAKKTVINDIQQHISLLKSEYNDHFTKLIHLVMENCKDNKSLNQWIAMAKHCEAQGNDMLGYAIRNAFSELATDKKMQTQLEKSKEYQQLKQGYFETFFSSGTYKERVSKMQTRAISPSLQFYFTIADAANTREDDFKTVKKLSDSITQEEWEKSIASVKGKNELDDKENIMQGLKAHHPSKEDAASEVYSVIRKYYVDSQQKLQGLFNKVNDYFEQKKKGEVDPFFERYRAATNAELVDRNKPLITPKPPLTYTAPKPLKNATSRTDTNFKLLTPHDMNRLYANVVKSSELRNKNGLIKDFRMNINVLAEGHTASKHKMNYSMPLVEQITEMLSEQKLDKDNLKREMKHALQVRAALTQLAAVNNIDRPAVDKLIASFNEQLKRLDKNAIILGDTKNSAKIREMILSDDKGKEEAYKSAPAVKQPTTAEKRSYLTKSRAGLFTKNRVTQAEDNTVELNNKNRK